MALALEDMSEKVNYINDEMNSYFNKCDVCQQSRTLLKVTYQRELVLTSLDGKKRPVFEDYVRDFMSTSRLWERIFFILCLPLSDMLVAPHYLNIPNSYMVQKLIKLVSER